MEEAGSDEAGGKSVAEDAGPLEVAAVVLFSGSLMMVRWSG